MKHVAARHKQYKFPPFLMVRREIALEADLTVTERRMGIILYTRKRWRPGGGVPWLAICFIVHVGASDMSRPVTTCEYGHVEAQDRVLSLVTCGMGGYIER